MIFMEVFDKTSCSSGIAPSQISVQILMRSANFGADSVDLADNTLLQHKLFCSH